MISGKDLGRDRNWENTAVFVLVALTKFFAESF
jgi:hypothetical protein